MLAQGYLEASAELKPDKVALVCGAQRLTYRELDEAANRFARFLLEAGARRGDRVAILLENSAELVIAIFGTLKAGCVFMVLHPGTKADRLATLFDDALPAAFVTSTTHADEVGDLGAAARSLRCIVWVGDGSPAIGNEVCSINWAALSDLPSSRPRCAAIDADLAALIYTSGSTGQPKGVMVTHLNMATVTTSINAYLQNNADDVILNVLPLAFGYGLYQIHLAFQVGARLVLEKSFAFPAHIIALVEQEQVTALPGVPTVFALLLKYPDLLRRGLPSLRYITNAGAALPTDHVRQLRQALPHVRLFSMYGLTECQRVSYLPPEELDRRPSSVGIAIPNTEAYVVGEDGERLPPGRTGELVVRGSHVTRGYWRAPGLTAQRFKPGELSEETVLHTGDLFRMDEDGYLYFAARKDDIIKSRGEKVSPREVEEAVCRIPQVAAAAVVGVPDEVLGQAVALVVEPHVGAALSERQVRAHCARTLAGYMLPKYVRVAAELPRTQNGKVDKKRIQAEFARCVELQDSSTVGAGRS